MLILNPVSGSGDHPPEIRRQAREREFDIRETDASGDARRFTREAVVEGVSLIAVAGGDGTVNEVVHGLSDADGFETVDVAIIPTGTANLFARSLGIDGVQKAFDILDRGHRRRIDVGFADSRPFLNTCLAGLSAEANTATKGQLKRRLGVFAYVLTTVRLLPEYEGVPLQITIDRNDSESGSPTNTWRGRALLVVIGNSFRLPDIRRRDRPSSEDGLLEVTILEKQFTSNMSKEDAISQRTLDNLSPLDRLEASSLSICGLQDEQVTFSLDGELFTAEELDIRVQERCLSLYVEPE